MAKQKECPSIEWHLTPEHVHMCIAIPPKHRTHDLGFPSGYISRTVISFPRGLDIPHYRFDWQIIYYEEHPLHVPKGTRMEITAHWDNSANNPYNPDPRADVHLGPQNSGEMLVCHTGLTVDRHASLTNLVTVENSTR